jgi:hypothetical protein
MIGRRTFIAAMSWMYICGFASNEPLKAFELYSWQDAKEVWNFSRLPNTSSEKSVEEVFDKRFLLVGINNLKNRLSTLPGKSKIFWLDRVPSGSGPKAKGSEELKYPPVMVREEIRQYGALHNVEIEILR